MIDKIRNFFENNAFGVCNKLAEKTNISSESVRMFFIYASFITLGSPIIIYLSLAFVIKLRKHFRRYWLTFRGF
jgi:phage shock protein PspC (stress-responsive transcriptional regulator)